MKRTTLCALSALFALSLSLSSVSAQGHRGGNRGNSGSAIGNVRGNHSSKDNGYRPGNQPNGNHNNNNAFRPGNSNGNHHNNNDYRPGNSSTRPGVAPVRPGTNIRPSAPPVRPGNNYRPAPVRPGVIVNRPYRPYIAPARPFLRPLPPASWRPATRINLWSSILGITVGMTITNTVNRLINAGHTVDGYGSNEVYLRNVNQYGFLWPDATMFYNNGGFVGSRFHYSTLAYNMNRYRDVFSYLTSLYGAPISTSSDSQGNSATWWGQGNQYITLSYGPMLTDSGQRYFTTLSIGI